MVEAVKEIVAPVLGIPLAVKLALNQMKLLAWMGVPLKLEMLVEGEQVDWAAAELTNNIAVLRSTIAEDCFIIVWTCFSFGSALAELEVLMMLRTGLRRKPYDLIRVLA